MVVGPVAGVGGLSSLRGMEAGGGECGGLSELGDGKWRASKATWRESLEGQLTEHHRFMLEGLLAQVAFWDAQSARLDRRVEEPRRPFAVQLQRLDTIDGIDRRGAQSLWAELGPDMAQFPDAGHLSSWAEPGPGRKCGQTSEWQDEQGQQMAAAHVDASGLGGDAPQGRVSVGPVSSTGIATREDAGDRRGGHTILVAAYPILRDSVGYHDLGGDDFDRLRHERPVSYLVRRLQRLGYCVALEAAEGRVIESVR